MYKYRVLSIDWDYYVKATLEQRVRLFPDGHVWSLPLEAHIWATHYSKTVGREEPELPQIGVYHRDMNSTITALQRLCLHPGRGHRKLVCIAHNHDSIYKAVMDTLMQYFSDKDVALRIVNIDFHHDVYSNQALDAGNWVYHFWEKDKENFEYKWVRRPTSDMEHSVIPLPKTSYSLSKALSEDYDFIFICKSGLWSPPHLDNCFKLLCAPVLEAARKGLVLGYAESDVLEDRMKTVNPLVQQLNEAMDKIPFPTKK